MPRPSNQNEDDALDFTCPVCEAPPGSWCIYVGHNARAGRETTRIHHPRLPFTALRALQAFDRREEDALRRWLRRYVHLLIKTG